MIGIIGGTGLYKIEELTNVEALEVNTPFGPPSAPMTVGRWGDQKVAFLPRHGTSHQLLPSEINFRANIWALKASGVRQVFSVSAVGSLEKEIRPGDLSLPNQYIDFTKGIRERTFFGKGLVAHASTAEPVCSYLSSMTRKTAEAVSSIRVHSKKTYACVEGPRLGTRAESFHLQGAGAHLVGMTNVPEVFLAREAQLCYCTIAVITDYDCWLDDPAEHASVDKVIELYRKNIGHVQEILKSTIQKLGANDGCTCRHSLKFSLLTQESSLSEENKKILEVLRR